MKPKNFPGRKLRRRMVAQKALTRETFDAAHPEIADMCCRIGRLQRETIRPTSSRKVVEVYEEKWETQSHASAQFR